MWCKGRGTGNVSFKDILSYGGTASRIRAERGCEQWQCQTDFQIRTVVLGERWFLFWMSGTAIVICHRVESRSRHVELEDPKSTWNCIDLIWFASNCVRFASHVWSRSHSFERVVYLHHLQQYFDLICIINQKSLSIEGISIWGQLQTPALITPKTELIYSYWDSDSLYYSTNINQQYEYVSTACRQLSSFKGSPHLRW